MAVQPHRFPLSITDMDDMRPAFAYVGIGMVPSNIFILVMIDC